MDSNASQSPGPDSSRRRSGRVVKVPDKFAPDPAHAAAKRKRGIELDGDDAENEAPLDSDAEMSEGGAPDQDDEPSEGQESDDEAAARRRAALKKKKVAKPSRPRKPANKRVKTNGASSGHAASLPTRPKKTVRIERLPTEGTGLFGQSLQPLL